MVDALTSGMQAFPAPAKLNLFLHVVGRRNDGYHLLQSAFRFIDHADTVWLSTREDGRIVRKTALPGVPEECDLTLRAARLLQAESGCAQGAEIALEKRLPMGGGLGGGSSDAATVLLALNHLWQLDMSRATLQKIALRLGADVPVFIFGRSAFAEGVGEVLSPIALPPAWYVVLTPPVAVATAAVFAAPELTRDTPGIKMSDFLAGVGPEVRDELFGRNDLQAVVTAKHPEVARHLDWLGQQALAWGGEARMTGSGACVFLPTPDEACARAIMGRLPPDMHGFTARGLDEHPLFGLVR